MLADAARSLLLELLELLELGDPKKPPMQWEVTPMSCTEHTFLPSYRHYCLVGG